MKFTSCMSGSKQITNKQKMFGHKNDNIYNYSSGSSCQAKTLLYYIQNKQLHVQRYYFKTNADFFFFFDEMRSKFWQGTHMGMIGKACLDIYKHR